MLHDLVDDLSHLALLAIVRFKPRTTARARQWFLGRRRHAGKPTVLRRSVRRRKSMLKDASDCARTRSAASVCAKWAAFRRPAYEAISQGPCTHARTQRRGISDARVLRPHIALLFPVDFVCSLAVMAPCERRRDRVPP